LIMTICDLIPGFYSSTFVLMKSLHCEKQPTRRT
jgi:hypothetical protein